MKIELEVDVPEGLYSEAALEKALKARLAELLNGPALGKLNA